MPEQTLAASLEHLATELRSLRSGVDADALQRRRENRTTMAILLVVLVGLIVTVVVGAQTAIISRQNAQFAAQIKDCTTVGGKCAEAARKQSEYNRARLIRGAIATSWCSRHSEPDATPVQLQACVDKVVAQTDPGR